VTKELQNVRRPTGSPIKSFLLLPIQISGVSELLTNQLYQKRYEGVLEILRQEGGSKRGSGTLSRGGRHEPIDYRLHWRMARARDELGQAERSLSEIAFAIGFQSASAFSTAFRRMGGCFPKRFADSVR